MNIVKQSLLLCIGLLLGLLALQGGQSLWQVSRLSSATDAIVASNNVATQSQVLWNTFVETDAQFKAATAFVDALAAQSQRENFTAQLKLMADTAAKVKDGASDELKLPAEMLVTGVSQWSALAARHLSAEGLTELPSYHVLEEARGVLKTQIGVLMQVSSQKAAALALLSHERARSAMILTVLELVIAVLVGLGVGRYALASLRRQLGADASEVADVSNAMADGDLTVAIRAEALPAGSVMAATARMQRSLVETVSRVRSISQGLSTGIDEIATGNTDLSQRTEQQASALERTAVTMGQLGKTVRHNADSAREANQLAQGAATVAQQGGAVVGQVVATMKGINDSSKKIADIIGVIDGIAFQTNILALNAAVESARAGEQGRGFAVVAAEVRMLAQRSAAAAREIKALIHASVEQVDQGTRLVDQAGATMHDIVDAIGRVTRIMGEISSASAQQSAGVAQVGQAVSELDRATQQNATLAEEGAAAAEHLRNQARQLIDAVSVFKLAAGAQALVLPVAPRVRPAAVLPKQPAVERRGPNRATNVVRPAFDKAVPAPADAAAAHPTGSDDWTSF